MLATQKEVQEMTHEKIDTKIEAALHERKLQESLSLQMRIGGLPSPWCTEADTFEESIDKLNNLQQPINIKSNTIFSINDTRRHVLLEHCVLTFKDNKESMKLLCQSHLLKNTKL